jgi:hypothetical protein
MNHFVYNGEYDHALYESHGVIQPINVETVDKLKQEIAELRKYVHPEVVEEIKQKVWNNETNN